MWILRSCLLVFIFVFFGVAHAEHLRAVRGHVDTDGAAVYAHPDFDSPVIDHLSEGAKIPISLKQFLGNSGMGLFHKVRTPRGKLGYMPDTDVVLPKGARVIPPRNVPSAFERKDHAQQDNMNNSQSGDQSDRQRREIERERDDNHKPIYLTRYMGGTLALVDYAEKFSGKKLHAQTPFIGFRMTGPNILFNSPPMDFNIQLSPMAPSYLKNLSGHSGSGFLLMTDLMLNMPLYQTRHSLFYYGLGVLLNFSDYKVQVGAGSYNSQDVRLGMDFSAGYAYRFSRYAVRGDLKFYVEKTFYMSEILTFQMEY